MNVKVLVSQSFLTLSDPMDCSSPGFSVHGMILARILEWFAISSSWRSYRRKDWTCSSCIGRQSLYHWTSWEAPMMQYELFISAKSHQWMQPTTEGQLSLPDPLNICSITKSMLPDIGNLKLEDSNLFWKKAKKQIQKAGHSTGNFKSRARGDSTFKRTNLQVIVNGFCLDSELGKLRVKKSLTWLSDFHFHHKSTFWKQLEKCVYTLRIIW